MLPLSVTVVCVSPSSLRRTSIFDGLRVSPTPTLGTIRCGSTDLMFQPMLEIALRQAQDTSSNGSSIRNSSLSLVMYPGYVSDWVDRKVQGKINASALLRPQHLALRGGELGIAEQALTMQVGEALKFIGQAAPKHRFVLTVFIERCS